MAIAVNNLISKLRFALDAEGSDHYNDERDLVPAINSAVQWLISVVNSTLGHKKLGEEIFRELKVVEVHYASRDSRISLSKMEHEPWTILAVYPNPTIGVSDGVLEDITENGNKESIRRTQKYHISADSSAKRLTIEEWATNKNNPFEAGYDGEVLCDGVTQYAYLDPFDYQQIGSSKAEIEVRPSIAKKNVTVFYVKKPNVVAVGGNIEFPDSVYSLIFNKALQYIAYKQGDGTSAYTVSQQDINLLLQAVN